MADARGVGATETVVGLASCSGYEISHVRERLKAVLTPLGGMSSVVSPGERIALKPNLLMAAEPDQAITTHPAVIEAVAQEVREAGAEPFLLESPGAGTPYSERFLRRVYRATGVLDLAARIGLELSFDTRVEAVSHPQGRLIKRMEILSPALEADGLISIPKLKTHNLMAFTGAVKNLFGLIPGYSKPGYHAKLADRNQFADMLLDINTRLPARLSVMDAVTALEGEGPGSSGDARFFGSLLASDDPVALDAVACRVAGIDPEVVPTLTVARERRMWTGVSGEVKVEGDSVESCSVQGFRLPERMAGGTGFNREGRGGRLAGRFVTGALNSRPRPKADRCTACRVCVNSCPTGAMSLAEQPSGDRSAQVDDDLCILCYCCHELCPEAAIDLEYQGMGRLVRAVQGLFA